MMDDSEDDLEMSFSSIHDLDHAPEPPASMLGGGAASSSSTSARAYSPRGHASRPTVGVHSSSMMMPTTRRGADPHQPHLHHSLQDPYQYASQSPGAGSASGNGSGSGGAAAAMAMAPRGRHRTASMNMYLLPSQQQQLHQHQPHRDRANSDSYYNEGSASASSLQYSLGGGGGGGSSGTPGSYAQRASSRRMVGFSDDEKNLMQYNSYDESSSNNNSIELGGIMGGTGGAAGGAGSSSGLGGGGADDAAAGHYGDLSNSMMNESARRLQWEKERLDSLDDSSANDYDDNGGTGRGASARGRDDQNDVSDGDDLGDSLATPTIFLGFQVPSYCAWRPDLHKIATFVVTRAPCFCCMGFRQPTDRAILARLNVLVAFFALVQIASTTFLAVVSFSPNLVDRTLETQTEAERAGAGHTETPASAITTAWTLNGYIYMLAFLAFIMLNASICTVRIIRNVNLVGAIRYLWVILWVVPFEIFFVIGLFDYYGVTGVWVKHYWRTPGMAWFRRLFCDPMSTANTLCTVPPSDNETGWCLENYNSTSCSAIRDSAQSNMKKYLFPYYYSNAAWGVAMICLLLLVVSTLESLISKPLVQKSRESNVPAWMSLPIFGCVVFGLIFSFSSSSVLNATESGTNLAFIGPFYLATAGLFFVASMLGWYISVSSILNTRHKRNKMIAIAAFVCLMVVIFCMLTTLFASSIAFSASLATFPMGDDQRGQIACFIDQSKTCTNCDALSNRCPEWSTLDVTKVVQTSAKGSAALAAIFIIYALSALRFGLGLRTHIRMYQIEYV